MATGLSVDGSTLALWRGDVATATLVDATGNYPLTKFGSIVGTPGLVGDAIIIDSPTKYFTHAGDATLRAFPSTGFWTVEALVKCLPNGGAFPGGGLEVLTYEDPLTNAWGLFVRIYGNDAAYHGGWDGSGGAGFVQIQHAAAPDFARLSVKSNQWTYVAFVHSVVSGLPKMTFYIDGRAVAYLTSPTPAQTFATAQLMIGSFWTAPNTPNPSDIHYAAINEIRLSTIERTAGEIAQNWKNYNQETFTVINPSLIISQGLIDGSNKFTLFDTDVSVADLADSFQGSVLDTDKWTDVSSGGGSISVDNALQLAVPVSGGVSAIESDNTWLNFDTTIEFSYDDSVDELFPTSEIIHARLRAKLDVINYFDVEHAWNPLLGQSVRAVNTVAGVKTILSEFAVESPARTLSLKRYKGRIQAFSGSNLLIDYDGWRTEAVQFAISTSCSSSPISLSTNISSFTPKPVVSFGNEIAPSVNEIAGRLIGGVPATKLPGLVEVVAHGAIESVSLGDVLNYVPPVQLSLDPKGTMTVSNDNTLRDTSSTQRGLKI